MPYKDPAKRAAYIKEYNWINRETIALKCRKWRAANPERANEQSRRSRLKGVYGLTEAAYDALLAKQSGCCAICKKPRHGQRLSVDHDHRCCPGKRTCGNCIRGLLCSVCNTALGGFDDSPLRLTSALEYLNSYV